GGSRPPRAAAARTSAAWPASWLGTPKWRNTWLLKSRSTSRGNSLVSTSAMFALPFWGLRRKRPTTGLRAKWNEKQANHKCNGRQRDGASQRSVVLNASANEKRERRPAKPCKRGGKSKSAGAA